MQRTDSVLEFGGIVERPADPQEGQERAEILRTVDDRSARNDPSTVCFKSSAGPADTHYASQSASIPLRGVLGFCPPRHSSGRVPDSVTFVENNSLPLDVDQSASLLSSLGLLGLGRAHALLAGHDLIRCDDDISLFELGLRYLSSVPVENDVFELSGGSVLIDLALPVGENAQRAD